MRNSKYSFFLFILYGFAVGIMVMAIVFCMLAEIPFGHLSRDANSIGASKFYYGGISSLGVLFWSFSAAISYYTYFLLRNTENQAILKFKKVRNFLLLGAGISLMLLLDDLFLLHETVFRVLFSLDEKITFGMYGLILLIYLVKFQHIIRSQTPFIYLILSFFFFALSLIFDFLPSFSEKWHHVFEDGPKFFGIISWFAYQVMASKGLYDDHQKN